MITGLPPAMIETSLPLPLVRRGKVRDVYAVDDDRLLLVTTDRISAFDVVMKEAIPYKGAVLTQLTAWWLSQLSGAVEHHLLSADTDEIVREVPALAPFHEALAGRTMLCLRADVIPIECVIRGYITGSAWKEYQAHGTLAGEALVVGLRESDRLDPPMFSPATKAETGHDENIPISSVIASVGSDTAATLERLARTVYEFGRVTAEPRGIIVADTKFEFGWRDGRLLLIDEVLTPDSSRFWPAASYTPGQGQPSFDKQPLRDWLEVERRAGRWNGEAPAPTLPDEVIWATSHRYRDAFTRLTGAPMELAHLGRSVDTV
ncbi:phosphoribosylaminoimidazolesuccinocarboxamide synthase [Gemmatimonas sp.]|uniref:phosphoribosylaminoimidazolesuccinocarboxamide synthase n=1 Tax=Gemmatimonas sp. TaxID=1962908 RepID=UPI0039836C85